jgi:PAS domain S-box-containing protein
VFRGFAQVNQTWNYAVARRFQTVPWTVFYMVPEAMFTEQVAQATRDKLLLATGIIVAAALAGLAFAASILRPVQALGHAAAAIARGDLATRIKESRGDELGQLGASFNAMAEGLQRSRDELEQRVRERTAALEVEIAERRRSEEALRAGEERTRLIVDTALDAVVTMDGAGMITGWSPQAERTFGWNKAEAIGRSLAETIIPPRYRDAHRRGLARYLATGEARVLNKRIELFALHRHGHEFPVELSITPIRTGVAVSFSAFVRDITERKRAEQSLRESQQMLQGIIDNSPAVIYVKDLEGRYLLVNRRFTELFHLSNEATVGRTDHDIFPQQVADAFRDMDRRVATAQHALAEEEVAPHDDGPHTYISVKCPLWDERGKPYAVFGISTDITERKRAETKQQSQLARLELLNRITRAIGERQDLPSIFQAVVRRLEDDMPLDFGCVCLHDPVAESLIVTSVGVRSQPLALELALPAQAPIPIDQNGLSRCVRGQLVYEPDVSQVPHPFPQRLARGGLRALVVAPLIVESEVFGVLVAARREAGAFSSDDCEFLRQLSEHVGLAAHQAQLHSALQRSYADLRQTQQAVMQQERLRALGQMAGGIAHDINNAISPVALYTESLLERENLSPRARASLETIQRAIDDVAQTVARMREFYRPREPQLALAAVELNRLVDQVIDLTRARWSDMPQQRGIVVHLVTDPASDLPVVMGVESEIREALINLVFNATDAMPEGGTLTLRTGRAASAEGSGAAPRAFVEVADTGIGMDEDTRRRCLEPFFTTKGERGTGLGLAMVYGVAQRHGAEIGIESQVGSGTTVRLTFPVPVAPATEGAKRAAADAPRTRLRVLIVDDDPILLSSLRDTLEGDGHVIEAANGGQQGIDAFHAANGRGQPFAAVITDLGMPHIDGRRVAQAVKEASPHTPVILLTGWGMRLINEGERPLHVDRVLSKPPKLQELREALASFS